MDLLIILRKVGTSILWSFFSEKLLAKLAFGILHKLAQQSSNKLVIELVNDAEQAYKG